MRVGIITIHNSPNYGACLQAFALWKYIEQQGCDCEIIDLYRPHQEEYIPSKIYKPYYKTRSVKSLLKKVIKIACLKKTKQLPYSIEAFAKFKKFNSAIKLSKAYKKIDDLYANPPIYDLYIAGSDQLWNPTQPYCLEPYFLTFVPQGSKKISFATSIGITNLTNKEKQDFKKWLLQFDAISVREKQAQTLLESFVNRDIEQVADPTFLLEESYWKSMIKIPTITQPYILLFTLNHNQQLLDYSLHLSTESGIPLIYLCQTAKQLDNSFTTITNASIEEFLGYIAHAEMVITESFHGTVFSLILGTKNFYSYISKNSVRGSRLEDLLTTFHLESHLLPQNMNASYKTLSEQHIDTNKISKIISIERKHSVTFLAKWINTEK